KASRSVRLSTTGFPVSGWTVRLWPYAAVANSTRHKNETANALFISHSQNHDLGRFDQRRCRLPRLQVHLACRTCRNDRRDLLIANGDPDSRHQPADSYTTPPADQLISPASPPHNQRSLGRSLRACAEKQPVHFALRYAMVPSRRAY